MSNETKTSCFVLILCGIILWFVFSGITQNKINLKPNEQIIVINKCQFDAHNWPWTNRENKLWPSIIARDPQGNLIITCGGGR